MSFLRRTIAAAALSLATLAPAGFAQAADLPVKAAKAPADLPWFILIDNRVSYSYIFTAAQPGAFSVQPNGTIDAKTRAGSGVFPAIEQFPSVLGQDFSGVVVQSPYDAHPIKPGDEVFGMVMVPRFGGTYAEYVSVPSISVVRKPSTLSHIEAAGAPLASQSVASHPGDGVAPPRPRRGEDHPGTCQSRDDAGLRGKRFPGRRGGGIPHRVDRGTEQRPDAPDVRQLCA